MRDDMLEGSNGGAQGNGDSGSDSGDVLFVVL